MGLEYTPFVRKPFLVDAIEVTTDNIRDIAPFVGDLKYDENTGVPYIAVDRKKVPNVHRVSIGYWVTRVNRKTRAYSDNSFAAQFTESNSQLEEWVDFINEPSHNIADADEADENKDYNQKAEGDDEDKDYNQKEAAS